MCCFLEVLNLWHNSCNNYAQAMLNLKKFFEYLKNFPDHKFKTNPILTKLRYLNKLAEDSLTEKNEFFIKQNTQKVEEKND